MSDSGSTKAIPKVSIGMPVFNGGELVAKALESLVSQEFTDFELIISDNASTDDTEQTCRRFAERDKRIRYIRRDRNYGMDVNGRLVLELSRGPYYMWAAHDDQWHPHFVGSCVQRLDARPTVLMAVPAVQFLNPDLTSTEFAYPALHTVGMGVRDRVASIFKQVNVGYNSYGLYRRSAIDKMDMRVGCYGGDVVMLMQIQLMGEVDYIPHKLFSYRLNGRTAQQQMEAINADMASRGMSRPYTWLTINLMRAINNSAVAPSLKRVLISDALEIVAIKNVEWRNSLLGENQALIPFVEPSASGYLPSSGTNLVAVLAALLLPYVYPGAPFDSPIDFSEIDGFGAISTTDRTRPSPGYREFTQSLAQLVEGKKIAEALVYYDEYRTVQPSSESVQQVDRLMRSLRPIYGTPGESRRSGNAPRTGLRVLFQVRPNHENMPGGDTMVQRHLQRQLEALGHTVTVTTQTDADLRGFDIVHTLNMTLSQILEASLNNALRQRKPFVVTSLQEDVPRYYPRCIATFGLIDQYVANGQRPETFEALKAAHYANPPAPQMLTSPLAARLAHRLLACGKTEADLLTTQYPMARVTIAHFGSNIIDADVGPEPFVEAFGVKDFVLCVARLETRKNQLMLLKALEDDDIPIVFADGGFTCQQQYTDLCKKFRRRGKTIYTGRLSSELLVSAYHAARVHCLPSWYELPGLVTLEAAQYGCAPVASSWGAIADYMGEYCEYCEPDSPQSIRTAVLHAMEQGIRPGTREHAATFTWQAAAQNVLRVYEEVL